MLEDPWDEVPDYVYSRTNNPEDAPDTPEIITIDFERGDAVAVNGEGMSPATLLAKLNDLGRTHGIGRLDLVENRYRRHEVARHVRDAGRHDPAPRASRHRADHARSRRRASEGRAGAALCRADLQRLLVQPRARDAAGGDRPFAGEGLRHGAAEALQGRGAHHRPADRPNSLYSEKVVTFEDDAGAYDQRDAEGFIKLNALRLRLLGRRDGR